MPAVNAVNPAQERAIAKETAKRWGNRPNTSPIGQAYSDPTELEIDEGLAHKLWCKKPLSAERHKEWLRLHLLIFEQYGSLGTATTRCGRCHTIRYNRPFDVPCGVCGAVRKVGDQPPVVDTRTGEMLE